MSGGHSAALAPRVAIVDFGLGNLFSVKHACSHVGLDARITSEANEILTADAVILPGVGAFGDAMATLRRLDLVSVLRDVAASTRSLVGICLGVQLLMTESAEFGRHAGLGIVEGDVARLPEQQEGGRSLKVPQIGWNTVHPVGTERWDGTLLEGVTPGTHVYFVHSFFVRPANNEVRLSMTRYGAVEFCSSLRLGNVFACQFHPERSASSGLLVYKNLALQLVRQRGGSNG